MKKNDFYKTNEEYNSDLSIVYNFHKKCYNTILNYLQEHGDIEIPEEWQDEYKYNFLEYEGTFTTLAIRLNKDKTDFYLDAVDCDGDSYRFDWSDINNDMVIIQALMDIIFNGFDS